jgi:hypothetical protein
MLSVVSSIYADVTQKAGKMTFYWGWNHSSYSNSDIHFKGADHDFTLYDVQAKDRQTPFGTIYFSSDLWIPQYNTRLSYYLDDRHAISFGLDHMKYFVRNSQTVNIEGSISTTRSSEHAGTYDGTTSKQIETGFVEFEHSDGLNYYSLELETFDPFWISRDKKHMVSTYWGLGAGVVIPKSNVKLLGGERHDEFDVTGYGLGFKGGVETLVYEDFFMRLAGKIGYIRMVDVLTSPNAIDKAEHDFRFYEGYVVFGYQF